MKLILLIIGVTLSTVVPAHANFSSNLIDPAMMTNYLPESQVDRNDNESIARNFQAQMIKKMFLQPAFGEQMSMFKDEDDSGMSIQSDYANEMLMHYLAQDMAKKDMLNLNEILNKGMTSE